LGLWYFTRGDSISDARRLPVLTTTPYESALSLLWSVVGGLLFLSALIGAAWYASLKPPTPPAVSVEIIDLAGGEEDGSIDETLRVDAPAEEERADASLAEEESETSEVEEMLDSVLELADQAVEQSEKQFDAAPETTGKKGKASGTGKAALGKGKGKAGFPREERWYVEYGDRQALDQYARILDFFGVEIGVLAQGKIVFVSQFSAAQPQRREVTSGAGEKRLYMTWQGGNRRLADLQLLRQAGVEAGSGTLFHFYPAAVEQRLLQLEYEFAKRKPEQVRRTYFSVRPAGRGYEFFVTRQTGLR
jgi:hypothetical protein